MWKDMKLLARAREYGNTHQLIDDDGNIRMLAKRNEHGKLVTYCYLRDKWLPFDDDGLLAEEIDFSPLDAEEAQDQADLKYDQGKPLFGLIPPEAELMEAKVLTFGAQKYEPNSWREIKDAERRYMDAMLRHINAIKSGETHDPESGLPHIAHVRTNSGFLCALMDSDK